MEPDYSPIFTFPTAVTGDLTRDEHVERLVKELEEQAGSVDILVNNAGGSDASKESWSALQLEPEKPALETKIYQSMNLETY